MTLAETIPFVEVCTGPFDAVTCADQCHSQGCSLVRLALKRRLLMQSYLQRFIVVGHFMTLTLLSPQRGFREE